jgi:hypothetical protein
MIWWTRAVRLCGCLGCTLEVDACMVEQLLRPGYRVCCLCGLDLHTVLLLMMMLLLLLLPVCHSLRVASSCTPRTLWTQQWCLTTNVSGAQRGGCYVACSGGGGMVVACSRPLLQSQPCAVISGSPSCITAPDCPSTRHCTPEATPPSHPITNSPSPF